MKKILSLFVVLSVAGVINSKAQNEKPLPPPPPPPPKPARIIVKSRNSNEEFLKRNPQVSYISSEGNNLFVVKLKSGKKEKYNLANEAEKKSFIEKYGNLPVNPPKVIEIKKFKPSQPPPPPPPVKVENN